MGSHRLPGTILAPLGERPLLAHIRERLRSARVDDWWLATSFEPADDVTEAWGFELGLRVHRGDPKDLRSRFAAIARETDADWILRVRADAPFVDAPLVDALLDGRDASEAAKQSDWLRIGGSSPPDAATGLPVGYCVELLRAGALGRTSRHLSDLDEPASIRGPREQESGLGLGLGLISSAIEIPAPAHWPSRPQWRWTIDSYEDLAMARSAFRVFGRHAPTIDYPAMVEQIEAHPEIAALNIRRGPDPAE
jgi:spore coat polysaccharide biosynthesis protein SpsF (cytidylyltransferase family)